MEMLILRRKGVGGLEGTHVPRGAEGEVEALVADLPPSEMRGLRRDEHVLGATEPMPLMLIEPVASSGDAAAAPAAQEVTWGVKAVGASTSPFNGKGVTVAVLDTGIDKNHPAFSGIDIIGKNFTQGDPQNFNDTHSHGTHCP